MKANHQTFPSFPNFSLGTRIVVTSIFLAAMLLLAACGPSAARYNNDGNDDYEAGDYTEAVDDYIAAQRENPDLAEPYYNAGNAYYRDGNLEAAAAQTQQSIRTAEDQLAQNSFYNLGNTYFKAEDWQKAIEAYKEALRINPDDSDAKYNLELALKKLEEQQQQQQQQQQSGGGGGQPPPSENDGEEQQEQSGQGQGDEQDESDGGGQPESDQSGQSGSQQQEQQSGGSSRDLTPQEAEQLLDALGQDSQTLQERLQQGFFAPDLPLPSSKDW